MASDIVTRFAWIRSQDSVKQRVSRRSLLASVGMFIAFIMTALWNVVLAALAWQGLQAVLGISW
jgi:hypothetical protein